MGKSEVGSGGEGGGSVGERSGPKVGIETPVTTTATATATKTAVMTATSDGGPPPHWELVKDLPSGGGSLYIIQADAQGATF